MGEVCGSVQQWRWVQLYVKAQTICIAWCCVHNSHVVFVTYHSSCYFTSVSTPFCGESGGDLCVMICELWSVASTCGLRLAAQHSRLCQQSLCTHKSPQIGEVNVHISWKGCKVRPARCQWDENANKVIEQPPTNYIH